MSKDYKKYNIDQCALYKCSNQRRLEKLLLVDINELKKMNEIIKYKSYPKKIKNGKTRDILEPKNRLKKIQKRILKLLQPIKRPDWLNSGEKKKSYIDNGKAHINAKCAITMDIKGFYDSCQREYVYLFFKEDLKTSGDIAKILTDLTTYNNKVPTGSPTSQIIAYHAYSLMFNEINEAAEKHGCLFTLYVDDMTFSSKKSFNVAKLESDVDVVLRKYGHKLKLSKDKYYSKEKTKVVTGVAISAEGELKTPNELQEKIYREFQEVKNITKEKATNEDKKKVLRIIGRLQAAKNIEANKFSEISRLVKIKNKELNN